MNLNEIITSLQKTLKISENQGDFLEGCAHEKCLPNHFAPVKEVHIVW